ncbi:uncharacterized protein SPPG_04486 [Spizellomyces punctatus DAOM BR117]|uniref:Meckel syndrome type 1 protein n=1 Tax=Spizellomyces punctatus (strain DAOM BR117) TaxID=645134 RepID=A0A0L0HGZ5_SPIPD|nr:uncharacterized protein SPPG_04486 [Spizellomyces punctatus DAOM BR117]KND00145.1 hypothetical protein SPPG_04486 [Spizellomyces punctatus DAOM BR117]|eukprot:XP_016608184.1 hypothetical protein SPPG_04486 [Spizellomyces punctatus DAOM BR117]
MTDLRTTSYHRTLDPVENLKIKVRLAKIADKNVPLIEETLYITEENRNRRSLLPKPEVAIVEWQQKIFSPSEVLQFKTLSGNPSPLERRYHEQVHKLAAKAKSREARVMSAGRTRGARKHIFTYVQEDDFLPKDLHSPTVTTSPWEHPSRLVDGVLGFEPIENNENNPEILVYRRKTPSRHAQPAKHRLVESGIHPKTHRETSDFVSKDPVHVQRPLLDAAFTEMHIMAYLHVEDSAPSLEIGRTGPLYEGVEKRLCTIKAYDNGLISFTPALQSRRAPKSAYRFTLGDDTYEFTIKNASEAITEADEEHEWKIFQEFYKQWVLFPADLVGTEFTAVPKLFGHRVNVMGEIVSARGFHGNGLYVRYMIDIPEGWKDETPLQILSSYTQVARSTYDEETVSYEARFGYPIDIQLMANRYDRIAQWPRIYFHIANVDWWGRHTTQGYGYAILPKTPGCHDLEIPTWRPFGSYLTRMRSFFIGGSADLEDLSYMAIPNGTSGNRLNKYGFQTESSGVLRVRLNIVHQAEV